MYNLPLHHHHPSSQAFFLHHPPPHQHPQQQQQQQHMDVPDTSSFHFFHPAEYPIDADTLSLLDDQPRDTAELCIQPNLLYPGPPTYLPPHVDNYDQQHHSPQPLAQAISLKRSPSPTLSESCSSSFSLNAPPPPVKKARTGERGERISSKDFVPPDVTGLSKREARLVKNRAAAFLSRQRKREEFEALEIRVQDLENENAQLRGGHSSSSSPASGDLQTEIARLRAELSTSAKRCQMLEADLGRLRSIKSEPVEEDVLSSDDDGSPRRLPSLLLPSSASATSSDDSKPSTPKERASGLMMALLLLLAPVISTPTPSTESYPNRFDYSFPPTGGLLDLDSPSMALSFDHVLAHGNGNNNQHHGNWLSYPSSSAYEVGYSEEPVSKSASRREVELDVQLTRDPSNPDLVKVRLLADPSTSSSLSLSNTFDSLALNTNPLPTPPATSTSASDFLGFPSPPLTSSSLSTPATAFDALPTSYAYSTGGGKKRVRISVDEDGEWAVEVK